MRDRSQITNKEVIDGVRAETSKWPAWKKRVMATYYKVIKQNEKAITATVDLPDQ